MPALLLLALVAVLRLALAVRQRAALAAQPGTDYARALLGQRTAQQFWQLLWAALLCLSIPRIGAAANAHGVTTTLAALVLAGWLWELPARAWKIFVTDARHGVNRLGAARFMREQALAFALFAAVAIPASLIAARIVERVDRLWWLPIWLLGWLGFLALRELKPRVQALLFDRLEPLPDGALRRRLEAMLARLGVAHARLLLLQASARSAQANAQAGGSLRAPRVLLHDTLIAQLPEDEVEAVAAHELGHLLRGHLVVQKLMLGACALPMLLAAGQLTAGIDGHAAKLAIAWALLPSLWLFALPAVNARYRRYEFEADQTAAQGASAAAMASALRRLTRHNANTPQPDRWYEWVYHTHPAITARLARLDGAS